MEQTLLDDRGARPSLLGDTDLPPVQIINPQGRSSFLLLGDHAGTVIPAALGTLGISSEDLKRHIAVDIGVQQLGEALAAELDAPFICQRYSRLVVDCNRDPASSQAVPEVSDGTIVTGNRDLSATERAARIAGIHAPYQATIARQLRARDAAGLETILVSLHSFTPVMSGIARPWDVGVLHAAGNDRLARSLLRILLQKKSLIVGDNEPYGMDATDHTVPIHAFPAGRPYVELEIRQDHLLRKGDVSAWSTRLALALASARGTS